MLWLEATVAFALSMFVFSTVVSGVLEAAQRLIGMREKGLRMMLERAFDDLSQCLRLPADDVRRAKFVEHMTANPMAPRLRGVRVARTSLCSLPVDEFLARLAETELGDEIARLGRARFDPLIKDVARRYERIGAAASSYFQERARTVTVVLSLALALVANIDGVRLFRTFLVTGLARLLGIGATPAKAGGEPSAAAPTLADSIHASSPRDAFETPRASRAGTAASRVR